MVIIFQKDGQVMLRFDAGEDFFKELLIFCTAHDIRGAWLSGLGSAQSVILSYYDARTKQFFDHEINEWMEITNLTGNIGVVAGEISFHLHGTFGDRNLQTKTGHIKRLIIGATCELWIARMPYELLRRHDEATGLNLLK